MKSAFWKRLADLDDWLRAQMHRFGIPLLRVSLGLIFLWFGFLKFFPEMSPAENLAQQTIDVLTFGIVPPALGMKILAAWESAVGIGLIVGKYLRLILFLLALQMLGAMSPIFLFPHKVFVIIPWVPTLEGQYIIKNLVLISAAIVIGATVDKPLVPPNQRPDATSPR